MNNSTEIKKNLKMSLIDYCEEYSSDIPTNGIFGALMDVHSSLPTWLKSIVIYDNTGVSTDISETIWEDYLSKYGLRKVSMLLARTPYVFDNWKALAIIVLKRFEDKWERIYDILVSTTYNPIDNYNMEENENVQSQNHYETGSDSNVFGFNTTSTDGVPSTKNVVEGDSTGDFDKNRRKLIRSGNIGVTTTQKMIEEELELRKHQFLDIIYADLNSVLTRPQY